jgi:xylan 1,4-beta-xylosidase
MKLKYILILMLLSNVKFNAQNLDRDQIYLADPTVLKDNEIYYLYGTNGDPNINGEGFLVYSSKDLIHWEGPVGATDGFALKKGDAYGDQGFWAPQVFKYKSKYYIAYTANEHIAIATANSPLGPFTNNIKALDAPVRQIDPFIFFDKGKPYLYHVRLQNGNRIFVAEMNEDLKSIKPETLKECINAKENWENTEKVEWPVAEGPTVFKHNGLYYLLYSANDFRNPDYAVGYATSKEPLGPWKKFKGNPIISQSNTNYPGIGHGDIFYDKDGNMNYVLHTHYSKNKVQPRKTGIIQLRFKRKQIMVEENSFKWVIKYQKIKHIINNEH